MKVNDWYFNVAEMKAPNRRTRRRKGSWSPLTSEGKARRDDDDEGGSGASRDHSSSYGGGYADRKGEEAGKTPAQSVKLKHQFSNKFNFFFR